MLDDNLLIKLKFLVQPFLYQIYKRIGLYSELEVLFKNVGLPEIAKDLRNARFNFNYSNTYKRF